MVRIDARDTVEQYINIISPAEARRVRAIEIRIEELVAETAALRGERQAMRNALWTRASYRRKQEARLKNG